MSKECNDTGCYSVMFNPLADLTALRHEYEKLLNAKAAIKELDGGEYCDGRYGRLDFEITIKRLDKSISDCKNALRKAEKRYFGV